MPAHRATSVLEEAKRAVESAVPRGRVGVAFSGGVDSALLARLCHIMGYDVTLLTTGFAGSHDATFAKEAARALGMAHEYAEIDPGGFGDAVECVRGVLGGARPSWVENAVAFRYVAALASGLGMHAVSTANGLDELFCGYDAYRREYHLGKEHLESMIPAKMAHEREMMAAIGDVVRPLGVGLVQPFMSEEFEGFAAQIPVSEKITGPDDYLRKHPVRRLAREVGVPEMSYTKRKKALQYGTGIHRAL